MFGEPGRLSSWDAIERPVSSELIRLECLRTIDRARLQGRLPDLLVAETRARVLDAIRRFELVPIAAEVIERAAQAFPTLIGSLNAIHLATALFLRDIDPAAVTFATHDLELATAARSMGFTLAA